MVRSGSLKGRLVDTSGKPVKGATLQLNATDWMINAYKSVTTDGKGCFVAKDIYPTSYSIRVSQDSNLTAQALSDVAVNVGETTRAKDMIAVPGVYVSGKVVDNATGKPVTGGQINVSGPMTGGRDSRFYYDLDNQGRFQFRACPGKVSIQFGARDGLYCFDYQSKTIDVTQAGASGVVLKVRAADTIAGKVVDGNGKPVSGAKVCVDGEPRTQTSTDAAGRFSAMVAPNRDWGRTENGTPQVVLEVIDAEGRQGIYVQMDRPELIKSKNLTLALKPARQFSLTVKDSQGKPLPGVEARLAKSYSEMVMFGDPMITDENGQAVFDVYEGGNYGPIAKLDGYYYPGSYHNPNCVGSKEWVDRVEIKMEPATRVQKGKVVDVTGKPVAGATVRAYSIDKSTRTDTGGLFVLEGLPDTEIGLDVQKGSSYGNESVSKDSGDITIKLRKE